MWNDQIGRKKIVTKEKKLGWYFPWLYNSVPFSLNKKSWIFVYYLDLVLIASIILNK
jgi:hypothetical protein